MAKERNVWFFCIQNTSSNITDSRNQDGQKQVSKANI